MWRATLSRPLPVDALVGRYPTNKLIGHGPLHCREAPKGPPLWSGDHAISGHYQVLPALSLKPRRAPLSLSIRYVIHALLTRPPLNLHSITTTEVPFDLHALATPPAFVLSQDQTLCVYFVVADARRTGPKTGNAIHPLTSKGFTPYRSACLVRQTDRFGSYEHDRHQLRIPQVKNSASPACPTSTRRFLFGHPLLTCQRTFGRRSFFDSRPEPRIVSHSQGLSTPLAA
jgi:hypothetical protein